MQRYEDKPFAILGVNFEDPYGVFRATCQKEKFPWASLSDETQRTGDDWGVRAFPTLFLVDAAGKIRFRSEGAPPLPELQGHIDTLLAETK